MILQQLLPPLLLLLLATASLLAAQTQQVQLGRQMALEHTSLRVVHQPAVYASLFGNVRQSSSRSRSVGVTDGWLDTLRDQEKTVVFWSSQLGNVTEILTSNEACADWSCQCQLDYVVSSTRTSFLNDDDETIWNQSQPVTGPHAQPVVYTDKQSVIKLNHIVSFNTQAVTRLRCHGNSTIDPQVINACDVRAADTNANASASASLVVTNSMFADSTVSVTFVLRLRSSDVRLPPIRLKLDSENGNEAANEYLFEPTLAEARERDVLLTVRIPDSVHKRIGEHVTATAYAISSCETYALSRTTLYLPFATADNANYLLYISASSLFVATQRGEVLRSLNLTASHSSQRKLLSLTDVAVLYRESLVFVSDNNSRVYKIRLDAGGNATLLKATDLSKTCNEDYRLSVDWLRNEIYLIGCKELWICSIDLDCLSVHTFRSSPNRILVDPISGWLFYNSDGKLHLFNLDATSRKVISDNFIAEVDNVTSFRVQDSDASILRYSNGTMLFDVNFRSSRKISEVSFANCYSDFDSDSSQNIYTMCGGLLKTYFYQRNNNTYSAGPPIRVLGGIRAFAVFSNYSQKVPDVRDTIEVHKAVFLSQSVHLEWSYVNVDSGLTYGALRWLPSTFELRVQLLQQNVLLNLIVDGYRTTIHDLLPSNQYDLAVRPVVGDYYTTLEVDLVSGSTRSADLHGLAFFCARKPTIEYRVVDRSALSTNLQYTWVQTNAFCSNPPSSFSEFALLDNYLISLNEDNDLHVYEMNGTCYAPLSQLEVQSVSSFAVDSLTGTVYFSNGSSIYRFAVSASKALSSPSVRLCVGVDGTVTKLVVQSESALLCWSTRNEQTAEVLVSCSKLNGTGQLPIQSYAKSVDLLSFDSVHSDQDGKTVTTLYWLVEENDDQVEQLFRAEIISSGASVVRGNLTLVHEFTNFAFERPAKAAVRDLLLFWLQEGEMRYLDLGQSAILDSNLESVEANCDDELVHSFVFADVPFTDEERARIAVNLLPQELSIEDVVVERLQTDSHAVSVAWPAQRTSQAFTVQCEQAAAQRTDANSVTIRSASQNAYLNCSIVASTYWADVRVIDHRFEVLSDSALAVSNVTAFSTYRRDAGTNWTVTRQLTVAWTVARSHSRVFRNFTLVRQSCDDSRESCVRDRFVVDPSATTVLAFNVSKRYPAFDLTGYRTSPSLLHAKVIEQSNSYSVDSSSTSATDCIRISSCSSYRCRSDAGQICLNETKFDQPLPSFYGLFQNNIVQMDVLSATMLKFEQIPATQSYCFSMSERLLFFVSDQNRSILATDLADPNSQFFAFWTSNGTITGMACDWLGKRVFWTEMNNDKHDIFTRSYVRLAGLQNGNDLVAHLAPNTTVTDFKFSSLHNTLFWIASEHGETRRRQVTMFYYNVSKFANREASQLSIRCARTKQNESESEVKIGRNFCFRQPSVSQRQSGNVPLELLLINETGHTSFLFNPATRECTAVYADPFLTCAASGSDSFYLLTPTGELRRAIVGESQSSLVSRSVTIAKLSSDPVSEQSVLPPVACVSPPLAAQNTNTNGKRKKRREAFDAKYAIGLTELRVTNTSVTVLFDLSNVTAVLNKIGDSFCSRPLWSYPMMLKVVYSRSTRQRSARQSVEKTACVHTGLQRFEMKTISLTVQNLAPFSNYSVRAELYWLHGVEPVVSSPALTLRTREGVPSRPVNLDLQVLGLLSYRISWQHENGYSGNASNLEYAVVITNAKGYKRVSPVNDLACSLESNQCVAWFEIKETEKQRTAFSLATRNKLLKSGADISADRFSSFSDRLEKDYPSQTPRDIAVVDAKSREVTVQFECSRADRYHLVWIEKPASPVPLWRIAAHIPPQNKLISAGTCDGPRNYTLRNLQPATDYLVGNHIYLTASKIYVVWPPEGLLVRTRPDIPDCTRIKVTLADGVYSVSWRSPNDNGASISRYRVFVRVFCAETNQTTRWVGLEDVGAYTSSIQVTSSKILTIISGEKPFNSGQSLSLSAAAPWRSDLVNSNDTRRVVFAVIAENSIGSNVQCYAANEDNVHELKGSLVGAVRDSLQPSLVDTYQNAALTVIMAIAVILILFIGICAALRSNRSLRMKVAERLHLPILLTDGDRFALHTSQQVKFFSGTHSNTSTLGGSTTGTFPGVNNIGYQPVSGDSALTNTDPSLMRLPSASPKSQSELVQLRFKPQVQTQEENMLYESSAQALPQEALADVNRLPRISRSEIRLTKFLGSGAFGKVYEGVLTVNQLQSKIRSVSTAASVPTDSLKDASSSSTIEAKPKLQIRVAIKTLRKNATNHERNEFLREALLMMNFDHDHIVRLIGVCFEACSSVILHLDSAQTSSWPEFIILELMNEGDLLNYLRRARPTASQACQLNKLDLLGIIADVSNGCKYLEDLHFVHRDIATRNCLVHCTADASGLVQRVTKISDFGLARDIYRNDYYRKEGEGLLPVRWMSPEALIDGLFTTQSDVWAYGVLVWEVFTLGQQPYPARTNIEVLEYVRNGGRLDRPINCPDELYNLLLRCWDSSPRVRPTFAEIQTSIEAFLNEAKRDSMFKCDLQFDETDLARFVATAKDVHSGKCEDLRDASPPIDYHTQSNTSTLFSKRTGSADNGDDISSSSFRVFPSNAGYLRPKPYIVGGGRSSSFSSAAGSTRKMSESSQTELLQNSDRPSTTSSYVTLVEKTSAPDSQTVTTTLSGSRPTSHASPSSERYQLPPSSDAAYRNMTLNMPVMIPPGYTAMQPSRSAFKPENA